MSKKTIFCFVVSAAVMIAVAPQVFADSVAAGASYTFIGCYTSSTTIPCTTTTIPQEEACWLTGGGVKFEPLVGMVMATAKGNGNGGPDISIGGNVNPGCSPTAGDGGNWNHIDHQSRLHFQGTHIEVVECGNMHDEGIEPIYDGSTSPKTPFNYIEFQGTGTLKGIKGNKDDYGEVCFYARAEDRSEPGSKETLGSAFIDRYWIRVDDCAGTELYRFGYDYPNPTTICADDSFACTDTIAITGGNLQIHISSCDSDQINYTGLREME